MKTCTACYRLFGDEGGFCPIDGQRLLPLEQAQIPSDPQDKRLGRTFCKGHYQLWRKVADGGMGRVYQAVDLQLNRGVALKILHSDVALDEVSLERFRREFEVSASLPHDHIVEVFDFQETEDHSFALVMEYLEGEELRMLLKRDKVMPPERVIRMLSQLAIGLAAAHDRKVVHRDLKPDNIFLCGTQDGDIVKILDFGSVRDNSEGAKKLTVMGTTIGSPFYMSPEQAQGLVSLDHRADVWSLGAILYECLTGKVPFQGPTGPAILLAILGEQPPLPSEIGKEQGVPVTLDPVLQASLIKNPEERIPSIAELADRVGYAYGLTGTHAAWACLPQPQIAARIAEGLPAALAAFHEERHEQTRKMDEAFFKPPAPAPKPFVEDVVMGVPQPVSRWIIPSIAVGAVLVGVLVALLIAR